jgi:hypothetical protein
MEYNYLASTTKKNIKINFLSLFGFFYDKKNQLTDKVSLSIHCNSKGYSNTYNTPFISRELHAIIYYFDVLTSRPNSVFVMKCSLRVIVFKLKHY